MHNLHINNRDGGQKIRIKTKLLIIIILYGRTALAADYFDPSLLVPTNSKDGKHTVDLSYFESYGENVPGDYLIDIYINNNFWSTKTTRFYKDKNGKVVPSITLAMLNDMGVKTNFLDGNDQVKKDAPLGDIANFIHNASTKFDQSKLRLDISIPQIYMNPDASDNINPELWQQGINAFLLNYAFNGSNSKQDQTASSSQQEQNSMFASFNAGLNLGAWRLRSNATWVHSHQSQQSYDTPDDALQKAGNTHDQWNFLDTYLQRDVQTLRGEMTIGDTAIGNVASQVFDGFSYRGASLATNMAMIPDRLQGFAPIISGIASSNARVTVSQNGNVIFESNVPPGPFKFNDINNISNNGDLEVSITEADGSQHGYRLPVSSVPVMQRQGVLLYEYDIGRYYQNGGYTDGAHEKPFTLVSLIYGMPHDMTMYGGMLAAKGYQSAALGTAMGIGALGAVSLDATVSHTQLVGTNNSASGSSFRLKYAKSVLATGTTLNLATYRYSTSGFYNFQDANTAGFNINSQFMPWLSHRQKANWQISVNQDLRWGGAFSLSALRTEYWDGEKPDNTLSAGFNNNIKGINLAVNYSVDHIRGSGDWPQNRQVSLNISVPFRIFSPNQYIAGSSANFYMAHDSTGRTTTQTGLNGSLGNNISWYATQNRGNQGQSTGTSAGVGYDGSVGQTSVGYYNDENQHSINYSLSGGLLADRYAVTLAPTINDSAVLVRTAHVSDVQIMNGSGVKTDHWGYAVIPTVTPYRRNVISLDPSSLPDGVDLADTSQNIWPTQGAIVLANYRVRIGQQVLINLIYKNSPVPFGAIAVLNGGDKQDISSIVGDDGQVYMNGMPESGRLNVSWGKSVAQRCVADFSLGKPVPQTQRKNYTNIKQKTIKCR